MDIGKYIKTKKKDSIIFENKNDSTEFEKLKKYNTDFYEITRIITDDILLVNPVHVENNKLVSKDSSMNITAKSSWFEECSLSFKDKDQSYSESKKKDTSEDTTFILSMNTYRISVKKKRLLIDSYDYYNEKIFNYYIKQPKQIRKIGKVTIHFEIEETNQHGYMTINFENRISKEDTIYYPIIEISDLFIQHNVVNKKIKKSSNNDLKIIGLAISKEQFENIIFNKKAYLSEKGINAKFLLKKKRELTTNANRVIKIPITCIYDYTYYLVELYLDKIQLQKETLIVPIKNIEFYNPDSNKVGEKTRWQYKDIDIQLSDNNCMITYFDMNHIKSISINRYLDIDQFIDKDCIQFLKNLNNNSTLRIHYNNQLCFVAMFIKKDVLNHYLIDIRHNLVKDEIDKKIIKEKNKHSIEIKSSLKAKRKKWKTDSITISINEKYYYFSYKDIKDIETIKSTKTILLNKDVKAECIENLMKMNSDSSIFISYMSYTILELRLSRIIHPWLYEIEIIADNTKKFETRINKNNTSNIIESRTIANKNNTYSETEYQIKKNKHYSISFVALKNSREIISEIQLISTSHNHSTSSHKVTDKVVTFAYYDTALKKYNTFNISVHYCETCRRYFDFKKSFELQINKIGLKLQDVLSCFYNDYMSPIEFKTFGLNEHSLLSKYGYSVRKGGPKKYERQNILKHIIENSIMSRSQIKSFLEYLIKFNGKKSHMDDAITKWENDIDYINKLIKKDNNY